MAATTHFRFPLPDPMNYADEDAERVKQALISVDGELYGQGVRLAQALETVDGALRETRADLGAEMDETERRVNAALATQQNDVSGRIRLLRLSNLLGLGL